MGLSDRDYIKTRELYGIKKPRSDILTIAVGVCLGLMLFWFIGISGGSLLLYSAALGLERAAEEVISQQSFAASMRETPNFVRPASYSGSNSSVDGHFHPNAEPNEYLWEWNYIKGKDQICYYHKVSTRKVCYPVSTNVSSSE